MIALTSFNLKHRTHSWITGSMSTSFISRQDLGSDNASVTPRWTQRVNSLTLCVHRCVFLFNHSMAIPYSMNLAPGAPRTMNLIYNKRALMQISSLQGLRRLSDSETQGYHDMRFLPRLLPSSARLMRWCVESMGHWPRCRPSTSCPR